MGFADSMPVVLNLLALSIIIMVLVLIKYLVDCELLLFTWPTAFIIELIRLPASRQCPAAIPAIKQLFDKLAYCVISPIAHPVTSCETDRMPLLNAVILACLTPPDMDVRNCDTVCGPLPSLLGQDETTNNDIVHEIDLSWMIMSSESSNMSQTGPDDRVECDKKSELGLLIPILAHIFKLAVHQLSSLINAVATRCRQLCDQTVLTNIHQSILRLIVRALSSTLADLDPINVAPIKSNLLIFCTSLYLHQAGPNRTPALEDVQDCVDLLLPGLPYPADDMDVFIREFNTVRWSELARLQYWVLLRPVIGTRCEEIGTWHSLGSQLASNLGHLLDADCVKNELGIVFPSGSLNPGRICSPGVLFVAFFFASLSPLSSASIEKALLRDNWTSAHVTPAVIVTAILHTLKAVLKLGKPSCWVRLIYFLRNLFVKRILVKPLRIKADLCLLDLSSLAGFCDIMDLISDVVHAWCLTNVGKNQSVGLPPLSREQEREFDLLCSTLCSLLGVTCSSPVAIQSQHDAPTCRYIVGVVSGIVFRLASRVQYWRDLGLPADMVSRLKSAVELARDSMLI